MAASSLVFNAAYTAAVAAFTQGRTSLSNISTVQSVSATFATAVETAIGAGAITTTSQQLLLNGIVQSVLGGRVPASASNLTSLVAAVAAAYATAVTSIPAA
jgi:hypothetical protein